MTMIKARLARFLRARLLVAAGAGLLALPCAADSASITVSANVLSRALCFFLSGNTLAINVPTINPSGTATMSGSVNTSFWCIGATPQVSYSATASDGNHSPGPGLRRMQHGTVPAEYLDYSLAITPAAGLVNRFTTVNVVVTASVPAAAYQNARAGSYSDRVVLTIAP